VVRGQQWTSLATMAWLRMHGICVYLCVVPSLCGTEFHTQILCVRHVYHFFSSVIIIVTFCHHNVTPLWWYTVSVNSYMSKEFNVLNIFTFYVVSVHFMSHSIGLSCSAWRCFTGSWSDRLHEECLAAVNVFGVGVWVILKYRLIGLKIGRFKYATFCDTSCVQWLEETSFSTLIIFRFFFSLL
jgi:hypothetical protein